MLFELRSGLRKRTAFAAALLVLASLSACGDDEAQAGGEVATGGWDSVVAAAEKEGSVVFYGGKGEEVLRRVADAFEKKYPNIQAEFVRLTSGELAERVDEERTAGNLGADVVWNAEIRWQEKHIEAGDVIKPDGPSTDGWNQEDYASGRVRLSTDPIGIMYNTERVSKPPTDWPDLIDDAYRGAIVSIDTVATPTLAFYDFLETKFGREYLEDLGELGVVLQPSSAPSAQSVASGESAICPYGYSWLAVPLAEQGAPVEIVYPSSGTVTFDQSAVVFNDAPHPNAARVLLDYMMSEEGQLVINGDKQGFSVVPGLDTGLDIAPELLNVPDWERYDDPAVRQRIEATVDELLRG
ncbi:ABC transporter substrate-binding protein [Actinophytocola sp.]|uniref:ABC transporter substrate-binding protein n=1 Tax=Actinophytocola sp. TaxID=1872138 RepID=UPI003D6A7AB0